MKKKIKRSKRSKNTGSRSKYPLLTYLRPFLRRASMYWPEKNKAFNDAKIMPGSYKCAMCDKGYKRNELKADHIEPIIDPKLGFIDFNTYINRMFVPADKFQILCKSYHDTKTKLENKLRKKYKK